MSEQKKANDRPLPWGGDESGESIGFGSWLRRQREIRRIPLREIADSTKVSVRYLEALEQDRFDVLPADVFAKGFLREYAKYVGLDPDEVINTFITATAGEEGEQRSTPERGEEAARTRNGGAAVALAVLAAILLVLAGIWYWSRLQGTAEEVPPAIVLPPVERQAPPPSTEPPIPEETAPLRVTLDFTEDCWVEAEVDGVRRLSELHVQGESMRMEARDLILLTLGNPGGVRLEVNGNPYEFDYREDAVTRDLRIDVVLAESLQGGEGRGG